MDDIIKSLETLFKGSDKIRFLTDTTGKVLWSNVKNDGKKPKIYFPDEIMRDNKTEKHERVSVNNTLYSASGSIICNEDNSYILWKADTIEDILLSFGRTDTYVDTAFMLGNARGNVRALAHTANEIKAKSTTDRETANAAQSQIGECYNLLRSIDAINQLLSVIYRKASRKGALNIVEELEAIITETEKYLSAYNLISVNTDNANIENLYINASQQYLRSALFNIMKKFLGCSKMASYEITVTTNRKNIFIEIPYKFDSEIQTNSVDDDFEMFSVKMYFNSIGAEMTEEINENCNIIKLTLPVYRADAFHANISEYNETVLADLAEIYLYGLRNEFK